MMVQLSMKTLYLKQKYNLKKQFLNNWGDYIEQYQFYD